MDHDVQAAMLRYIDALRRSADLNDTFADHVMALVRVIEADPREDEVPGWR